MNRRVAWLAILLVPSVVAFAGEEEDTQTPAVSPTPFTAFGVAGVDAAGKRAVARELLGEPDPVRGTFRWWFPLAGKNWSGGHAVDASTTREGTLRAWAHSSNGRKLELRANADRRPLAFRTRIPFGASSLEEAGTHRESAKILFSSPIPWKRGRVDLFAEWRGGGGLRPSTSAAYATGDAGPAFLAPAWRQGDHGSTSAGAVIRGEFAGAQVALDGRIADESTRSTFHAPDLSPEGGLRLTGTERRRVGEAGISVDMPMGALVAGGSYRFRASQGEGRGGRRQDTPTGAPGETYLDDVDLRTVTQRGSLGVAFLPLPSVRTGVTATATSHALRADSVERRDLGDDSVSRADASLDRFGTAIAADAVWIARSWISVEARGDLEATRFEDEWTQTLLAPGGSSVVSTREQSVTRVRAYSKLESSVTAGPWKSLRATAGASAENESYDVVKSRAVDSPLMEDRSRERTTVFARLRARPAAGFTVEARAKSFDEERDLGGTTPSRRGAELRGRASYARNGGSVFAVAAVTDDRYDLAKLPADAQGLGFLPIELDGRSWIFSNGVTVPFRKDWRASATATQVVHANDFDSRLLDVALDVGGALNERLRLSAGVRRLDWQDDRSPWDDASATVGFALLSGSL